MNGMVRLHDITFALVFSSLILNAVMFLFCFHFRNNFAELKTMLTEALGKDLDVVERHPVVPVHSPYKTKPLKKNKVIYKTDAQRAVQESEKQSTTPMV